MPRHAAVMLSADALRSRHHVCHVTHGARRVIVMSSRCACRNTSRYGCAATLDYATLLRALIDAFAAAAFSPPLMPLLLICHYFAATRILLLSYY